MNDLDTTASVGAAQATVDDGGEDVNNSEINDLRRQIDELRALLNARVGTTAAVGRETSEQSDSVRGESSVRPGAPGAAAEYQAGGHLAHATGKVSGRGGQSSGTPGQRGQGSTSSPGSTEWWETVDIVVGSGLATDGFGGVPVELFVFRPLQNSTEWKNLIQVG